MAIWIKGKVYPNNPCFNKVLDTRFLRGYGLVWKYGWGRGPKKKQHFIIFTYPILP